MYNALQDLFLEGSDLVSLTINFETFNVGRFTRSPSVQTLHPTTNSKQRHSLRQPFTSSEAIYDLSKVPKRYKSSPIPAGSSSLLSLRQVLEELHQLQSLPIS